MAPIFSERRCHKWHPTRLAAVGERRDCCPALQNLSEGGDLKISCACGNKIVDQTDYLPDKAHLIPDMEWFEMFDEIDKEIIDPLLDVSADPKKIYFHARMAIQKHARLIYQCCNCGRLYMGSASGAGQWFRPESPEVSKEILKLRKNEI